MTTDSTELYDAALALPEGNRADLAYRLLQTLKPPSMLSEDDTDLSAELERRVQAYESGDSTAADWKTVSVRLRDSLDRQPRNDREA